MFENTFYNVWFSERDIRLIIRIFACYEFISNLENQSIKNIRFQRFPFWISDVKDDKDDAKDDL